jgi:hypothetical protein
MRKRHTGELSELERGIFLALLENGALVSEAAAGCGVSTQQLYVFRGRDPGFREEWEAAYRRGADIYAREAVRRGVDGVNEKPIVVGGKVVGHTRDYSDTLLLALLNARDPARYDPRVRAMIAEWERADRQAEQGAADPSAQAAAFEAIAALERIATAKALEAKAPAPEPAPEAPEPACPTEAD